MTTWFTADQHLGHRNIIEYCNRPFSSVEEMDATIIAKHNEVVLPGDVVYIIGDFTLRPLEEAMNYLARLNGVIHVLPGSHDAWIPKDVQVLHVPKPIIIEPPMLEIHTPRMGRVNRNYLTMCHYAMLRWPRSHHGSMHLYGHSHGQLKHPLPRAMDVGVDCFDFYPVSMGQVLDMLTPKGEDTT